MRLQGWIVLSAAWMSVATVVRAEDNDIFIARQKGDEWVELERLPRQQLDGHRVVGSEAAKEVAYLGVAISPVPPALAHQLRIADGLGAVVEQVLPEGPAKQAGIEQYDIIYKFDDHLLNRAEDLPRLVQSDRPGDQVEVVLIREGKFHTLTVTLAAHELAPTYAPVRPQPAPAPWQPWQAPNQPLPLRPPPQRAQPPHVQPDHKNGKRIIIKWTDGDQELTITDSAGHRRLEVRDASGDTVFEGPIDTTRQRNNIPREIRRKLDRLKLPDVKAEPDRSDDLNEGPREDE